MYPYPSKDGYKVVIRINVAIPLFFDDIWSSPRSQLHPTGPRPRRSQTWRIVEKLRWVQYMRWRKALMRPWKFETIKDGLPLDGIIIFLDCIADDYVMTQSSSPKQDTCTPSFYQIAQTKRFSTRALVTFMRAASPEPSLTETFYAIFPYIDGRRSSSLSRRASLGRWL
jgi:hypothetical protein